MTFQILLGSLLNPFFLSLHEKLQLSRENFFFLNWVFLIHPSLYNILRLEHFFMIAKKHEGLHRNYTLVVNVNDFSAQNIATIFMYAIAM